MKKERKRERARNCESATRERNFRRVTEESKERDEVRFRELTKEREKELGKERHRERKKRERGTPRWRRRESECVRT